MILHVNLHIFPLRQNNTFLVRGAYQSYRLVAAGLTDTQKKMPLTVTMPYSFETIVAHNRTMIDFMNSITTRLTNEGFSFIGWQMYCHIRTGQTKYRCLYIKDPRNIAQPAARSWCRNNWRNSGVSHHVFPEGSTGLL